jgi:hypothetical protein
VRTPENFLSEVSEMLRTRVLWEAGKEAWVRLRDLQVAEWKMKRTGYSASRVADRVCEFCLALLTVERKGEDADEVAEWAIRLADAVAALERLRVLLLLTGKPESIRLSADEVEALQKLLVGRLPSE